MQTFLPVASFEESARILDYRRLGKQRVEAAQLIKAITVGSGWSNHPASKQWRGHLLLLCEYGVVMCHEWKRRGYEDNLLDVFRDASVDAPVVEDPKWLGLEVYHASHRSNLLRKDPLYYRKFGWSEPLNLPYVWPC
jgi:hypothetical protein